MMLQQPVEVRTNIDIGPDFLRGGSAWEWVQIAVEDRLPLLIVPPIGAGPGLFA
jgi:hypothetical protein